MGASETSMFMGLAAQKFFETDIQKSIQNQSNEIEATENYKIYECDQSCFPKIDLALKRVRQRSELVNYLPSLALSGAIAHYDGFLKKLLVRVYTTKPQILKNSDKSLSFSELSDFDSLENAKDYLVSQYAESIIRDGHLEQLKKIEKDFSIRLREDLPILETFIEACERRNCIIHNGGVVSNSYLKNLTRNNIKTKLKIGDQLKINNEYLENAIGAIYEIGFKLSQVLWRKLLTTDIEAADSAVINNPLYLLKTKRYDLACRIYEYSHKYIKNWHSDTNRLIIIVNYANALKLSGNPEESKNILSSEKWDATEAKFKICVAAVRDDELKCLGLIEKFHTTTDIGINEISDWPVFETLLNSKTFIEKIEEIFGESIINTIKTEKESSEPSNTPIDEKESFG